MATAIRLKERPLPSRRQVDRALARDVKAAGETAKNNHRATERTIHQKDVENALLENKHPRKHVPRVF